MENPSAYRPPDLTNRIALVAGATRGVGRGIALALGEAGATVYCTGRSTAANRVAIDVSGAPSEVRRRPSSRSIRRHLVGCRSRFTTRIDPILPGPTPKAKIRPPGSPLIATRKARNARMRSRPEASRRFIVESEAQPAFMLRQLRSSPR